MVTVCVGENTIVNLFNSAGPRESQCHVNGFHFPLFVCPAASHLPKVLILQSASARAGADRTFSDQYLGQVRAGEQMKEEGTEPGSAASGLLVVLFAGRSWRMVRVVQANVDHVSAVCKWNVKRISASAIV